MAKNRFVHLFLASAVWLSLGGTMAYAQTLYNKTVTLSIKKAKLGKILKSIQEKSAIQIVYNGQLVDQVAAQTVVANNEKLTDLLNRLLNGTGLEYVIEKNVIVIRAKRQGEQISTSVNGVTFTVKSETFVNGRVTSDKGVDMAAVTVTNLETGASTFTDYQGKFALNAQTGDRLQISYVGYKAQRQTLKNLNALQIVMEPQEAMLDEVVLTGYQSIKKKLSTGSIFTLKGEDVVEPNVPNIASMLQGKVPGLYVETLSGSPNSIPKMRMRGTSTLIGNANPIWVIDGIVQENPTDVNPDNPIGMDPSFWDTYLRGGTTQASADLMGNSIAGINIKDIESINFLKDAAATALYGTRAANGVIVLTTKKGHVGRNIIDYSTDLGFVQRPSYNQMNLMNSKERIQLSREIINDGLRFQSIPLNFGYEGVYKELINGHISEDEFNKKVKQMEVVNTDWFDLLFRNSFNQSHSLSLSGGSEKATFRSSVTYRDNKGAAKKDGLRSVGGLTALDWRATKKIQIQFQLNGGLDVATGYNNLVVNPNTYALTTSRTLGTDEFYETKLPAFGGIPAFPEKPLHFNVMNELEQSGSQTKTSRLSANINVLYKILPGLDFNTIFGAQLSAQNSEQYSTERTFDVAKSRGYDYGSVLPGGIEEQMSSLPFGGILNTSNENLYRYSWSNRLTYKKKLFNERDELSLLLGQEINSTKREGFSQYQWGYLRDRGESFAKLDRYFYYFNMLKNNKIENYLSAFAVANYSYAQKYIIEGSMRVDASNRFGQQTNSRFLPVWSASARWNVSEEPWLRNSNIISNLGLVASYGAQGNTVSTVGPDLILQSSPNGAVDPMAQEYILTMRSLAYPDLRWERTQSKNLGISLSMFNSFVNIDAQLYHKQTRDAITALNVPLEYGTTIMYINGGTIINKGLDLGINFNLIRNKDWTWNLGTTISKNKNNLRRGTDVNYDFDSYLNGQALLPNEAVGTFYVFGYKGLNPENGQPLFRNIDEAEDPTKLTMDEYLFKAGKKEYTLSGGVNNTIRYHNFSLSTQFTFAFGANRLRNPLFNGGNFNYLPKADQNVQRWLLDRWRKPGDEQHTDIPGLTDYLSPSQQNFGAYTRNRYTMYDHSDALLSKADYLKCRSLRLSYTLPADWLKSINVSSALVGLSMSNVFTIAGKDWKGQDPELPGIGSSSLPQVRTYNLNVNISF